nr:hypothetical protein [uncultured Roseateles sp.]
MAAARRTRVVKKLLWIDGAAAALAGVAVLSFSGGLSQLHAIPQDLLLFIGAINLLYACYSCSLAVRARRPISLIKLLVFANGFWALICLGLAVMFAGTATIFGLGHLLGEALFVGGLTSFEWRWRERLLTAA